MSRHRFSVVFAAIAGFACCTSMAVAVDKPIEGDKVLLKDSVSPNLRRLQFSTSDPNIIFGSNADSDTPSVHGASLLVFNPDTGEHQCIIMPAEHWTLGEPSGLRYKYRDRTMSSGPVQVVLFKQGKVKLVAKGALLTMTLDESTQGRMSVRFTSGDASTLCTDFDVPRVDHPNIYLAVDAPVGPCETPPVACDPSPVATTTTTTLP